MKRSSRLLTTTLLCIGLSSAVVHAQSDDQGITNDVHKANVGNIVFANDPISFKTPDASLFKKDFSASETIFGRLYLPQSISNTPVERITNDKGEVLLKLGDIKGESTEFPGNAVNLSYHVSINGVPIVTEMKGKFSDVNPNAMYTWFVAGDEMYIWTTRQLFFLPPSDFEHLDRDEIRDPSIAFAKALTTQKPGKHTVDVEIRFTCMSSNCEGGLSEPIASGQFTLNLTEDDLATLGKEYGRGLPEAKMRNKTLEASMKKALKDADWEYEIIKVAIVQSDWQINRNSFGHITDRSLDTYVAFKMKDDMYKAFNISFKQLYDGKNYGTTQVRGVGNSFPVDGSTLLNPSRTY